jgi:hypothetical protein
MSAIHDQALEDAMRLEINLRPHVAKKNVFGKMIEKSFGKDFVDMKGDDGIYRHVGWYLHSAKCFSGLVNWDNQLNESMCKAIEEKTGVACTYVGAPQDEPELTQEDDDEFA